MANRNGLAIGQQQQRKNDLEGLLKRMAPALAQALPEHVSPDRISRIALTAIRMNPQLAQCSSASFLGALLQATQLGLEVNTPLGQAYLIPFGDKLGQRHAQLVIGYQGMMDLARRSGEVGSIQARCVYEGDEFTYEFGLEPVLKHRPCPTPGNLEYVYALARMKAGGEPLFTVLSAEKVEQFRKRSRARDSGPWMTDYDAMAMKTAVRRLYTWLPKSAEVARAIAVDDATELYRRQSDQFDPTITGALAELGEGDAEPPEGDAEEQSP